MALNREGWHFFQTTIKTTGSFGCVNRRGGPSPHFLLILHCTNRVMHFPLAGTVQYLGCLDINRNDEIIEAT